MREMKDSGVEWIDKMPTEWETMPLKRLFSLRKGLNITKADLVNDGVPVINYGQIHAKDANGTRILPQHIRYIEPDSGLLNQNARAVSGDLIVADTSEDLRGCGNAVYVDVPSIYAGYHCILLRNDGGVNGRYLAYLMRTEAWRSQIRTRATAVKVYSVTQGILAQTTVLIPPLPEQHRIADFLDTKCAAIDDAKADVEREIALLREYKQTLITQAVTKGLNPDAPMKDSGVEWIGEIPEEWSVPSLRHSVKTIADVDHYMPENVDVGVPYIMTRDLSSRLSKIDLEKCKHISFDDYRRLSAKMLLEEDDVIFARYATIGAVCYVDRSVNAVVSYSCVILKPRAERLVGKYLYYYFQSAPFGVAADLQTNSNTQGNLGIEALSAILVPLPPLPEQHAIADFLDTKCSAIDDQIADLESELATLDEYKKSLIYNYVTGKKEVPVDAC